MGIKLIGIHGKAHAGKDTFAGTLVNEHGFHRMAFADPVRLATAVAFGWPPAKMFDSDFKTHFSEYWGLTVREAMQKVGTEAVRGTFGDDHWVKRWLMDYLPICGSQSVVVTDVREEIEASTIREMGGVIIHLRRDEAGLSGEEAKHRSESGIALHSNDLVIDNNGTLEELATSAHRLIQFIEINAAEFGLMNTLTN